MVSEGLGRGRGHRTHKELELGCKWPCMGVGDEVPVTEQDRAGQIAHPGISHLLHLGPWRQGARGATGCEGGCAPALQGGLWPPVPSHILWPSNLSLCCVQAGPWHV